MKHFTYIIFSILLLLASCSRSITDVNQTDDNLIEFAILQMNDVYEISGVSGGTKGNLARVAGYYNSVKEQYPNSMLVIAGDFLNPSLINTMKYEGERVKGKQMIEVLNAMDLDLAAFGNHEFDLDMDELQKRLNESNFQWIATNLQQSSCEISYPFYKVVGGKKQFIPDVFVRSFKDQDGTEVNVGIFSATINSNPKPFVLYQNPDSCAHLAIDELKLKSDVLIGLTHLEISEDIELAQREIGIDLIMGGHEHDNMIHRIGETVITKADANAKTVYLHVLKYNTKSDDLEIKSELVEINPSIPMDPAVGKVVAKWEQILEENIKEILPDPFHVVYKAETPLDGRESTIRNGQSNLGNLITSAMLRSSKGNAQAAILNSGSIRIDDQLQGDLTGIDVFRILPFGGGIVDVEITGKLLLEVLNYGDSHKGTGAYLQLGNINKIKDEWLLYEKSIDPTQSYHIVLNDFLLKGYDIPFLDHMNSGILAIDEPENASDDRSDIRVALINYLERK